MNYIMAALSVVVAIKAIDHAPLQYRWMAEGSLALVLMVGAAAMHISDALTKKKEEEKDATDLRQPGPGSSKPHH